VRRHHQVLDAADLRVDELAQLCGAVTVITATAIIGGSRATQ